MQALDSKLVDPLAIDRLVRIGGYEFLAKMIDTFFTHVPGLVEKARLAIIAEDREGTEFSAHTLKSSAGNLGAIHLMELARILEIAAEKSAFPEIAIVFEEVLEEYQKVENMFRELRKELP